MASIEFAGELRHQLDGLQNRAMRVQLLPPVPDCVPSQTAEAAGCNPAEPRSIRGGRSKMMVALVNQRTRPPVEREKRGQHPCATPTPL